MCYKPINKMKLKQIFTRHFFGSIPKIEFFESYASRINEDRYRCFDVLSKLSNCNGNVIQNNISVETFLNTRLIKNTLNSPHKPQNLKCFFQFQLNENRLLRTKFLHCQPQFLALFMLTLNHDIEYDFVYRYAHERHD